MNTYAFPIGVLATAAAARPAGYLDAVLAAGTVTGEGADRVVILTEDAYRTLAKKFGSKTPQQIDAALGARQPTIGGPGTELKSILRDWLGIEATAGCGCNQMATQMNARGPEWCESDAGMTAILEVMRKEHAKRWQDGRTKIPWTDLGATQLVRLACRRARAKAT